MDFNLTEDTSESARDSRETYLSNDMLTSNGSQYMASTSQYHTDLSASGTVEVSSRPDQFDTGLGDVVTDTLEAALPSSNSLAFETFESPIFRWDEGDSMNGYWQFTPLVRSALALQCR